MHTEIDLHYLLSLKDMHNLFSEVRNILHTSDVHTHMALRTERNNYVSGECFPTVIQPIQKNEFSHRIKI